MSVFTKLFGGKAGTAPSDRSARLSKLAAPSPGKPTYFDTAPGQVAVDFHVHDNVEGVPGNFLTAISEGLMQLRQRELVLTLRLADNEDPVPKMQDIVRFFTTVQAWAREGNIVDEGGFTQFGERGLFGRAHGGILYADARPITDLRLPERALAAVFVAADEIRAGHDYGTYRVLTRIGFQLRLFPFPTWGDLARPSAVTPRESESQVAQTTRLRAPGVTFVMADRRLRLLLPNETTPLLKGLSAIPNGVPFALLLRPDPSANAILVWSPGQEGISGISQDGSDGSQLSGSTLMVVPNAQRDEIRPFEDGYSVRFSAESWASLSACLVARRAFKLIVADGTSLEIDWRPKAD